MIKTPEDRRNIYSYILLGCVALMAVIGLLTIWNVGLQENFVFKAMASLGVVAACSGFLYTLTFNHDVAFIKKLGVFTGVAAVALTGVILAQIWFAAFSELFFGKLISSIVIVGLLAAFVIAVFDDFFENKKLKDQNYLD